MASSKFRITTDPPFGAKCSSCGMSGDGARNFLEWGTVIDFWGSMVLCEPCAREGMETLGLVPVADVSTLEDQVRSLTQLNQKVQAENERLNSTLDSLFRVRPDLGSDDVADVQDSEADNQGPEDEQFGFDEPLTGGGFEELSESQSADRVSPNFFSS